MLHLLRMSISHFLVLIVLSVVATSLAVAQDGHPTCIPYPSFPWNSALSYSALLTQFPTMVRANGTYQWTKVEDCQRPSISFNQAVEACSARSMRMCGAAEVTASPCASWTSTHCSSKNGEENRIQVSSKGERECKDPAAASAATIACCVDEPTVPQCRTCPKGTFPKPLSIRYPNERGLSLCSAVHVRPNVLFVIADDLKYLKNNREMNVMPNLLRLQQERGVSFENAHAQMAMCSPSRTSFLTSLRPDFTKSYKISDPTRPRRIPVTSVSQSFKRAGYQAYAFGKVFDGRSSGGRQDQDYPDSWTVPAWSLKAEAYSTTPNNTECGYGDRLYDSKTNIKPFSQCLTGSSGKFEKYYPDEQILALAMNKLREFSLSPRPFFLAVGFLRPHLPFVAPQRHYRKWSRSQFQFSNTIHGSRGPIFEEVAYNNDEPRTYSDFIGTSETDALPPLSVFQRFAHGYYASASYVDELFGRLMDELDRLDNIAKNTIVVFLGDHGFHLGDHMFYGKKTVYEEGTHVPLVLLGPKRLLPRTGIRISAPVELLDIGPTLYDLALIPRPQVMHGSSLVPLFRSADPVKQTKAAALSQFYAFNRFKMDGWSYSLRGLRYRYVVHIYRPTRTVLEEELYDYEEDPNEQVNLKGSHVELLNEFRILFSKYTGGKTKYDMFNHEIASKLSLGV